MNSETGPFITIAIPTFNRASWLKECVLSALAQSYPLFEVLVSDNASTDETPSVLRQLTDPRLRIWRQKKNIGSLKNWNFCLTEARGDYIVFLSDDDRIAPHLLERLTSLAKREPRIPIVLALCDAYEAAKATRWPAAASQKFGTGIWNGPDLLMEKLAGNISVSMCSIMIRTDMLRAIGGFPASIPYAGDMAAWATVLLEGKAGLVNESCALFCHHEASLTSSLPIDANIEDERRMMDAINGVADRVLENLRKRGEVKLFARRYFARRIVEILLSHRERGAGLMRELTPAIWRWRRDLRHIRPHDALKLARPICRAALPD